ncbi:hypothetical protein [Teredinibacter sp. KSP-S5-2]|uniref:hypothetical protein n=1 Tax=Teredinibacter sp. KSP-S5-2 TaxID=3034506 RepID=UPI002934D401|nr:hypothetical protein [Teredinibacter sp. KSP-S5-2]WNO11661.1 hypothetical protein P5V12_10805 [Teredinibacter sp. KSP-S5-2]
MNREKVEQLVVLVVIATVVEISVGAVLSFYMNKLMASGSSVLMESENFIFAIAPAIKIIAVQFVGLFIGWWLYTVTEARRELWFLLGLIATWWGLVVYALYLYAGTLEKTNNK